MTTDQRAVVHAVSTGSYSDYRVLCACPSAEDAEKLAARIGGEAEPFTLEVHSGDVAQILTYRMSIMLGDDGSEAHAREWTSIEWPWEVWPKVTPVGWRWCRPLVYQGRGGRLDVYGTDRTRVQQVYSDRRAMLKADDAMRAQTEAQG